MKPEASIVPGKLIGEPQRRLCASQQELWPGTSPSLLHQFPLESQGGTGRRQTGPAEPEFCSGDHPHRSHSAGALTPSVDTGS